MGQCVNQPGACDYRLESSSTDANQMTRETLADHFNPGSFDARGECTHDRTRHDGRLHGEPDLDWDLESKHFAQHIHLGTVKWGQAACGAQDAHKCAVLSSLPQHALPRCWPATGPRRFRRESRSCF
jgi:hypothetical protein